MRAPFVLALLLLAPLAQANAEGAEPQLGEAAEYVLRHAGGAQRVFLEWRVQDVWLPSGEERALATLRAIRVVDEPSASFAQLNPWNEAGRVPAAAQVVDLHWTAYPAPSVAWSASWMETGRHHQHWATRTTLGPCPEQAWFLAWAELSCAANGTAVEPGVGSLPEAVIGADWQLELVARRAGNAPLPSVATPLAPAPRIPIVAWTPEGPARGDLASYPFADARRALETQDPDAEAWLAQHADAPVMQARHAWSTTPTATWGDRMKGAPCTVSAAERIPGAEWAIAWLNADGSLFTIVQRVGVTPGVHRLLDAHIDNFNTGDAGGTPTTMAPAPADLAAQLPLVPESRGEVASIEYDFLPDGARASVSRGTCTRDAFTGRQSFQGAFVTFHDGVAMSTLELQADWDRPMLPLGLARGHVAPAARAELPDPPVGLQPATSIAVAAGVAALFGAALLYSRIHRGDALASDKRARILSFVQAHPGECIQEIARALDMPRNTVEHHVRTLGRTGFVMIHDGPRGKAVHASEQLAVGYAPLLAREHARELLDLVREQPGQPQAALAAKLGMRKGHFSRLVADLEAAGFVARKRVGRQKQVHPAREPASE